MSTFDPGAKIIGLLSKVYVAARSRDTQEWMMKREQLSPYYTAALGELPAVKLYGDGIHLIGAHKREWLFGLKQVPPKCYLKSPYDHQRESSRS